MLYAEYANLGYTQSKTYTVGENKAVMHTCWTQKGRIFLYENKYSTDFIQIAEGTALVGSMNSPTVRILVSEDHADAEIFTYDNSYSHSEARVSDDNSTVMLFSYKQFRIYDIGGELFPNTLKMVQANP